MAHRRLSRSRRWTRGTAAVVVLLTSAADHLATAIVGIPPLGYMARRAFAPLAAEWRAAVRPSRPGRPIVIRVTPADCTTTTNPKGF